MRHVTLLAGLARVMVQFYFTWLLLWLNEQDLASFENRLVCLCRNLPSGPMTSIRMGTYYLCRLLFLYIYTYLYLDIPACGHEILYERFF